MAEQNFIFGTTNLNKIVYPPDPASPTTTITLSSYSVAILSNENDFDKLSHVAESGVIEENIKGIRNNYSFMFFVGDCPNEVSEATFTSDFLPLQGLDVDFYPYSDNPTDFQVCIFNIRKTQFYRNNVLNSVIILNLIGKNLL